MDEWLAAYPGPTPPEFLDGLSMEKFSGDPKYLLRGLDRFVRWIKEGVICP